MTLLILGLALFLGIHTFTTMRGARAAVIGRLGEGGYKGLYSLLAAVGLVLIVIGFGRYRSSGYIQVWDPPRSFFHPISLFLLWFAFVSLTAAYAPTGRIKSLLRHPMLVGIKAWALSHLLVNGDLGSMLLFGGLLAWAVYDRIAVKRRGDPGAPAAGWSLNDLLVVLIGTGAYIAMFWLHDSLIGVTAA
jgi:uncharacterized membrane protein